MTRSDELIQRSIDGHLAPSEQVEFLELIEGDSELRRRYCDLCDVELDLRNLDESFDVSDQVMAKLRQAKLRLVAREPASIESKIDRWLPKLAISLTAAAAVMIAFVQFNREPFEPAEISSFEGTVTVMREGQGYAAGDLPALKPGDQVIVSKGSQSKLRYEDNTEVRVGSGTEIVFESKSPFQVAEVPSKRFELLSGRIEAKVSPQPDGQPLVFITPHAYAIVRGTILTLQCDEHHTRLDVAEGRVDLQQISDGNIVSVGAGEFAIASSGEAIIPARTSPRSNEGLVAFYTFQEGEAFTVRDRSGAAEPLDLRIESRGDRSGTWLLNGGYELVNGAALFSESTADRIVEACQDSEALSIEAWVEPNRTVQGGPARIVTFSKGGGNVNFMLGHGNSEGGSGESFVSRIRTSSAPAATAPSLEFEQRIDGSLVHLVVTRDPAGDLLFYRNGELTARKQLKGDFTNWQEGLKLGLGNDPGDNRPWEGSLFLVAIYSRALSSAEVLQNFRAGPNQTASDQR